VTHNSKKIILGKITRSNKKRKEENRKNIFFFREVGWRGLFFYVVVWGGLEKFYKVKI
jgi:hypothetical protein